MYVYSKSTGTFARENNPTACSLFLCFANITLVYFFLSDVHALEQENLLNQADHMVTISPVVPPVVPPSVPPVVPIVEPPPVERPIVEPPVVPIVELPPVVPAVVLPIVDIVFPAVFI